MLGLLVLVIVTLVFLAYLNYLAGSKALLYPPLVFCAVWAADLILILCADDFFYPLRAQTLFVFLCGAITFSLGSWLALGWQMHSQPQSAQDHRSISWLLVLVIAAAPFYYRWLTGLASDQNSGASLLMLTRMTTEEMVGKSTAFTLFGTLVEISRIVAMMAFYERGRHPKRAALAVLVALVLSALLGQKYGPISLIVALFAIHWLKVRRFNWRFAIVMLLIAVTFAGGLLFYVQVGDKPFSEKLIAVSHLFVLYAAGGPVGFDRVIRQPNIVPQFNPLSVYYLRIVRKLGGHVEVPEVAEFVSIGPYGLVDNVYTIYWSYLDLGYFGSVLVIGLIGFLVTLVYRRALSGGPMPVMLYAMLLYGVIFSTFNENFVSSLYFLAKLSALTWAVYHLPRLVHNEIAKARRIGRYGSQVDREAGSCRDRGQDTSSGIDGRARIASNA